MMMPEWDRLASSQLRCRRYGSMLQDRRHALHAKIVDAIEVLYPERLTEHVERLAHHAVRGELREKAVDYLRRAGLKAAARSALTDARVWFERCVSWRCCRRARPRWSKPSRPASSCGRCCTSSVKSGGR
jgi:hypothetical protein